MGKNILAVIVGYIVMAGFIFVTFSVVYMMIGTDGAFQEGTYDVSFTWILSSIVLGFIGALLGGWVAAIIGSTKLATKILAGLVLLLGLAMAIPTLSSNENAGKVRTGEVATMDAMQSAYQPSWVAFLNPIIGAVGVMAGACLKKDKK